MLELFSSCGKWKLLSICCAGFSFWGLLLLWGLGSRCVGFSSWGPWALEHRLNSCGAQAYLLCSMWDFPAPGTEPVFPALAGGFFTTEPPGKPLKFVFKNRCHLLDVGSLCWSLVVPVLSSLFLSGSCSGSTIRLFWWYFFFFFLFFFFLV